MAKLKTSVKRAGALTAAQSRHVSGMLDALARCASYSQDAVAVERPEAASAVAANAADEVKTRLLSCTHADGGTTPSSAYNSHNSPDSPIYASRHHSFSS